MEKIEDTTDYQETLHFCAENPPQVAARNWTRDRQALTAATERAEKAESQRDRMRDALERISNWTSDSRCNGALARMLCQMAAKALKEVGDE